MKDFFPTVFKKYNKALISKKGKEVIDEWYAAQTKANHEAPNELKNQQEVWTNIVKEIHTGVKKKSFNIWKWTAAAASVLCIGIASVWYVASLNVSKPLDLAHIQPATHHAILSGTAQNNTVKITELNQIEHIADINKLDLIELTAPKGASFDLTLPDGTIVFLNSDSKISYPKKFTGSERQITLEGEAYFEVAHNKEKPFIVTTPNASIKVLGTKFNVRAYDQKGENTIALLEGAVQLSNQFAKTILNPGELAVVQKDAPAIPIQSIGDMDPIAWKNGYFNFNDKPISELIAELARWYNVEFDLTHLNRNIRLNGKFARKETLKYILEKLSSTDELRFEVKDQHIIIKNN